MYICIWMNTHFYYKSTHSITDDDSTHCLVTTATTVFNISKCEATFYYKRKYIQKIYTVFQIYKESKAFKKSSLLSKSVLFYACVFVSLTRLPKVYREGAKNIVERWTLVYIIFLGGGKQRGGLDSRRLVARTAPLMVCGCFWCVLKVIELIIVARARASTENICISYKAYMLVMCAVYAPLFYFAQLFFVLSHLVMNLLPIYMV